MLELVPTKVYTVVFAAPVVLLTTVSVVQVPLFLVYVYVVSFATTFVTAPGVPS